MWRNKTVLLTLALLCAAPAASARPDLAARLGAPVTRDSLAFADWITPTERRQVFEWHGALVLQSVDPTGGRTRLGGVLRGLCTLRKNGFACSARGLPLRPRDTFEMDPEADRAFLEMRRGFKTHFVRWYVYDDVEGLRGTGSYGSESVCDEGQGHGGGIVRPAETRGSVFGRRFVSDRDSEMEFWNMLWSGAQVTQCGSVLMDDLRAVAAGRTIRMFRPLP